MGNCCKSGNQRLTDGGDLPIPGGLKSIKDPLVKFEKTFPFHRMSIVTMRELVHSFLDEKGRLEDLVSVNKFQEKLNDRPIWENQFNSDSPLYKVMEKLPGSIHKDDGLYVDPQAFLVLCILWCAGDQDDKAETFFLCLNGPG